MSRRVPFRAMVVSALIYTMLPLASYAGDDAKNLHRVERNGTLLELELPPNAGMLGLRLRDVQTKNPMEGRQAKVWLDLRRSEQVATETSCESKIKSFASGFLGARADVELNNYWLLTLNHDRSVAFINPQVAWNRTKLEALITLPGDGLDWALSLDRNWLYVTLPQSNAVAVIDTTTRKLTQTLSLDRGSRPTRIAVSPLDGSVWVGLDETSRIVRIDSPKNIVEYISVGQGLHQLAFDSSGKYLAVTNSAANSVSLIDTVTRHNVANLPVTGTPLKLVWGNASGRYYVAAVNSPTIVSVDPESRKISAKIELQPGVMEMGFELEGRYLFAVNQMRNRVDVIDSATNSVVAQAEIAGQPYEIAFTKRFAYLRGVATEKFSLIDLGDLRGRVGQGKPVALSVTSIQAGQRSPAEQSAQLGVAPMIAPIPEGNGVMIANNSDRQTYFYTEGLMAPAGALQNYQRMARGVLILDRGLRETAPGVFSAALKIPQTGKYDVAVLIDQPRIMHCFQVALNGGTDEKLVSKSSKFEVKPLFNVKALSAGKPVSLRFKIFAKIGGAPVTRLTDARLLLFEPPGMWQERLWLKEISAGIYEATIQFPRAGLYNAHVGIGSAGITFSDLPFTAISVVESVDADLSRKKHQGGSS